MIVPHKTYQSVAQELSEGLASGDVTLEVDRAQVDGEPSNPATGSKLTSPRENGAEPLKPAPPRNIVGDGPP
jgi:hypothetical protein